MTDEQLIAVLHSIQTRLDGQPKEIGAKDIYLASPWFDQVQAELLLVAYEQLLNNPTVGYIYVPLLHQYQDKVVTDYTGDKYEWGVATYNADVNGIKNSALTVALETPNDVDTGTSVEIGMTLGMNKPVLALFNGDLEATPVNLMESFGVTTYVTDPEELATIDVRALTPRKFSGKII